MCIFLAISITILLWLAILIDDFLFNIKMSRKERQRFKSLDPKMQEIILSVRNKNKSKS